MDLICAVLSGDLDRSTLISPSEETEKKERDPRRSNKSRPQFRSNFNAIIMLMKTVKLRQEHKLELQKTPFWPLFESIIEGKLDQSACKKSDGDVIKVIQTYDPKSKKFWLGNKSIQLTASDISLIFGISSGKQHIDTKYAGKPDSGFIKRRWAKTKKLTAPEIKEQMMIAVKGKKKTDVEDTARLLCMYICATLLFATSGHHLSWRLVSYIEDLDKMKSYAWSNAIINTLIAALDKSYARPEKTTACVLALLYWLCERTKIVKPEKAKAYPRFLKWNLRKLHEILVKKKLSNLKCYEVLDCELEKTKEEQKLHVKQIEEEDSSKQDENYDGKEDQGKDEEEEEENESEEEGEEEEKEENIEGEEKEEDENESEEEGEEAKGEHINDRENCNEETLIVCYNEGSIYNENVDLGSLDRPVQLAAGNSAIELANNRIEGILHNEEDLVNATVQENVDCGSLDSAIQLAAGNTAMELAHNKIEGIMYNEEDLVSATVEENLDFGSLVRIVQFGEENDKMELAHKRVEELELKLQQLEEKNKALINYCHIKENIITMLVVAEKGKLQEPIQDIDQYEDKEALLKEEIKMLKESKKTQEVHFGEMKKAKQAEIAEHKETVEKLKEQISKLTEKNMKLEESIAELKFQKITQAQIARTESKPETAEGEGTTRKRKKPPSYVQRIKRKQRTGKVLLNYKYKKPMKLSKKDAKDVKESAGAAIVELVS